MLSRSILHGALLFLQWRSVSSAVLYVSNSTDAGVGSAENPFGSLQRCVDQLAYQPVGSSCILLEGTYRFNETVRIQGLHGVSGAPYRIGGAPGATVTLDGTLDVPGPWMMRNSTHTFADGSTEARMHWVTAWPDDGRADPWQLFVEGEMMIPARWPNAFWHDRTVFNDTYWARGSQYSTYCGSELRDVQYAGPCQLFDGTPDDAPAGRRSLASSGINATGAVAVLNIGHWYSFAGRVLEHIPRTSSFIYERDDDGGGWKVAKYKPTADIYYLEGALSLLDAETEWYYDCTHRELHLKTRDGIDPGMLHVTARVQEYAIAAKGVSHVTFHNLRFFATTIYAAGEGTHADDDANNVRFDSLRLVHPSATKHMLGEARFSHPTTLASKKTTTSCNNTLFNTSFFGSEGYPLINTAGSGVTF